MGKYMSINEFKTIKLLILDVDGEKYFAHQKNVSDNTRLKTGVQVVFEPAESDKGKVANNIKTKNKAKNNNNQGGLKLLLVISFVLHAITLYAVFFK
jgi:cold shock CspA family protein